MLISDKLFRSKNFDQRKLYLKLVEGVEKKGGKVQIFSSMHVTGEQLNNLGGIAAILRYPFNMDYLENEVDQFISDSDDQASVDLDIDKYQAFVDLEEFHI